MSASRVITRALIAVAFLWAGWVALPSDLAAQDKEGIEAIDESAIREVVKGQLDAFQRDDGGAAFSYASPAIRKMFKTPEAFMDMVRRSYPAVYRPRWVAFEEIVNAEGKTVQPVTVLGPDNVPVLALYFMERQTDGRWLIDGCYIVPTGGEDA